MDAVLATEIRLVSDEGRFCAYVAFELLVIVDDDGPSLGGNAFGTGVELIDFGVERITLFRRVFFAFSDILLDAGRDGDKDGLDIGFTEGIEDAVKRCLVFIDWQTLFAPGDVIGAYHDDGGLWLCIEYGRKKALKLAHVVAWLAEIDDAGFWIEVDSRCKLHRCGDGGSGLASLEGDAQVVPLEFEWTLHHLRQ